MKPSSLVVRSIAAAVLALPLLAAAQNIAIVNGKPVPKSRVDTLLQQAVRSGQQLPPGAEQQARDQVVLREIFAQEAEKRGIARSANYRAQMELARQSITVFEDTATEWIVVNSAGCGAMLKEYGHLLADDPAFAARAQAFSRRVQDVSELLAAAPLHGTLHPVPVRAA